MFITYCLLFSHLFIHVVMSSFLSVLIKVEKLKRNIFCLQRNLYLHLKLWPSGFSSGRFLIKRQCRCEWSRVKRRLLPHYYLDILHKCGRDSLPSFSSQKVGTTRRIKQTGIRHEKRISSKGREMSAWKYKHLSNFCQVLTEIIPLRLNHLNSPLFYFFYLLVL